MWVFLNSLVGRVPNSNDVSRLEVPTCVGYVEQRLVYCDVGVGNYADGLAERDEVFHRLTDHSCLSGTRRAPDARKPVCHEGPCRLTLLVIEGCAAEGSPSFE